MGVVNRSTTLPEPARFPKITRQAPMHIWGMAEAGGFEPPVSCPTLVFKTSAFGHSATPPSREE